MAFGGYKFKGYKVVRANLATNTYANWCLLVHQARIKAFMESCALSGAQWQFSKTNGALNFEDYGNVIYRVANANGDYNDYLSFFKYGDEELYYMISTLGEYYWIGQGTPAVSVDASYEDYTASDTGVKAMGMSSALSLSQFADDGLFSDYPSSALPTTSVRTDFASKKITSSSSTFNVNETAPNNAFSDTSSWYIGYATKGKDIVTVTTSRIDASYEKYWSICVESGDAFSAYTSTIDIYGLMKCVFCNYPNEKPTGVPLSNKLYHSHCEALSDSGERLNWGRTPAQGYRSLLSFIWPPLPTYGAGFTKQYFEASVLSAIGQTNSSYYKVTTSEGNLNKGVVKGELISFTAADGSTLLPVYLTPYMGGNLLSIAAYEQISKAAFLSGDLPAQSSTYVYGTALVGWDSSNPDIRSESSWPELALQ